MTRWAALGAVARTPDLRGKVLFTLGMIAVYRMGAHLPVPGVDVAALRNLPSQSGQGGLVQLIDLFSGGAFTQLAVFALGIAPYITASIIMQLLTVVVPRLEGLRKEGQAGAQVITQWTRYLTVALALLQASALIALIDSGQVFGRTAPVVLIPHNGFGVRALMVLTFTAGTAVIMWLGELITQRGVGNGMSVLVFTAVIAQLPAQGRRIEQTDGWLVLGLFGLLLLALVAAVVLIEQGQRRVPVQYSQRQLGTRRYGGRRTYIPMKLNQAGVIPLVFASSVLAVPTLLTSLTGSATLQRLTQQYLGRGDNPVYMATYALLVVAFTFFYSSITFNPTDVADNLRRYGAFVPGLRPGRATESYLRHTLVRLTAMGSLYLAALALLPLVALAEAHVPFPLGGSAIIIAVGVALETLKAVEGQLVQHHYRGFLAG